MRITLRAAMRRLCIIGLMSVAFLLSACSANRLGYNHAPTLLYYWMDAYFDFDGPQSLAIKDSLQSLQAWHRKEELPPLAELLKNLQQPATQEVSAEQVCKLADYLQQRIQAPLNQLAPALVNLAVTLKPSQLQHVEAEFKRRNKTWREEWLDLSPAERVARRSQQIVERTEQFYGHLDDAQREMIRLQVVSSGYDPETQLREMLRRQQESLQTLSHLRNGQVAPDKALAEVQTLFTRALVPPDAAARQYAENVTRSVCVGAAAVHNSSTPAQKAKLVKTLQSYEADARTLMQSP